MRMLLVGDHPLFLDGLSNLLAEIVQRLQLRSRAQGLAYAREHGIIA